MDKKLQEYSDNDKKTYVDCNLLKGEEIEYSCEQNKSGSHVKSNYSESDTGTSWSSNNKEETDQNSSKAKK